jgi:hypothetical protein
MLTLLIDVSYDVLASHTSSDQPQVIVEREVKVKLILCGHDGLGATVWRIHQGVIFAAVRQYHDDH